MMLLKLRLEWHSNPANLTERVGSCSTHSQLCNENRCFSGVLKHESNRVGTKTGHPPADRLQLVPRWHAPSPRSPGEPADHPRIPRYCTFGSG